MTIASGTFAGKTGGFYVKAIDLTGDLSKFRLYFTSVQRANATYNALGATGSADFEEKLNRDFPTSTAADFAPMEAGIVDEDTYVEQGLMWKDAHWAYLAVHPRPGTGRSRHQAGPAPRRRARRRTSSSTSSWDSSRTTDIDGNPNPYYDDLTNDDVPDGRVADPRGLHPLGVPGGGRHARSWRAT